MTRTGTRALALRGVAHPVVLALGCCLVVALGMLLSAAPSGASSAWAPLVLWLAMALSAGFAISGSV